ncbi:MAG TPA: LysR family transcriptional regulator [Burkholderiales bacterium]|jgi:DNA-binding transcriptional LysR family regulator|nr:LysR family transcriptional regulator [Burkholderiales bacterium]
MDFAALQFFKAVVDEGGITAAAKKLHRVQSNVTTRIKQLEASLGAELFIRDKRRLSLSPAGELFRGYVEQLLQLSDQAREAVLGGTPRGTLRIGTLESIAASRLPPLLSGYHAAYPAVRVELATGTNDALLESVLGRKLDAAFVVESAGASQLEAMPTFDEELVVVAHAGHTKIRRARDAQADTVLAFPAGCAYRRRLQAWFAADDLVPERVMELSSYHAIVACAASGTGIAFIPRSVLDTVRGTENLAVYPLNDGIGKVTTCLVWRRGESSPALDALKMRLGSLRNGKQKKSAAKQRPVRPRTKSS